MLYNYGSRQNGKPSFKTIRIIHLALLAGQCLFLGVILFLRQTENTNTKQDSGVFLIVAALLSVTCFTGGRLLYNQMTGVAVKKISYTEKLSTYQSAMIVRFALSEGPTLFCIICLYLTGNMLFLLIAALWIAYFMSLRPRIGNIAETLSLTYEEKAEFEQ